jgi:hypothetical protein
MARARTVLVALLVITVGCSDGAADDARTIGEPVSTSTSVAATTSSSSTTTTLPPTTTTTALPRYVRDTGWAPFATVADVTLLHPAARVEMIGFHESAQDGAQPLEPLATAVRPLTLESRDRDTTPRGAADVVVDPATEIRAPVTGRVKRAGTYVLYCKHSDDFAVIEPDSHPGWEVKLLHIDGVRVRAGDRVVAGETVVAPHATQLPFESQVNEHTALPGWPHVHIEVVDPSIPDRPTPGAGC